MSFNLYGGHIRRNKEGAFRSGVNPPALKSQKRKQKKTMVKKNLRSRKKGRGNNNNNNIPEAVTFALLKGGIKKYGICRSF